MKWFDKDLCSRKTRATALGLLSAVMIVGLSLTAESQDMQNMPGMNKSKPAAQKKRTARKKKPAAKKREMGNMAGMKKPGKQKPKPTRRKQRGALKRQPAKKQGMGNKPGWKRPRDQG